MDLGHTPGYLVNSSMSALGYSSKIPAIFSVIWPSLVLKNASKVSDFAASHPRFDFRFIMHKRTIREGSTGHI